MKDIALEKISEMYFDPYFSKVFYQFVVEHIDNLSEKDFEKLVESCCLEETSKIKFYN